MSQLSGLGKTEAECFHTEIARLEEELKESQTVNYKLRVETSELKENRDDSDDDVTIQQRTEECLTPMMDTAKV